MASYFSQILDVLSAPLAEWAKEELQHMEASRMPNSKVVVEYGMTLKSVKVHMHKMCSY